MFPLSLSIIIMHLLPRLHSRNGSRRLFFSVAHWIPASTYLLSAIRIMALNGSLSIIGVGLLDSDRLVSNYKITCLVWLQGG